MQMKKSRRNNEKSRGSALLISLMVMVGLSLLGLGFVVISETENSISINERNYIQVLATAETGARLVLEWFQDPEWAQTQGLLPANIQIIKNRRQQTGAAPGSFANYDGYYKGAPDTPPGTLLFDKPHRPRSRDRFFGTADYPDVFINSTTEYGTTFLAQINAELFKDLTHGQITDIRIYAPPVIGGEINEHLVWEGGTRYGLATIQVTAEKISNGQSIARRVVRLVISEWPFPGPQGPVQSNANISTGGNFGVHWGRMTSEGSMNVKLPWVGIPWLDSWRSIPFEFGYFRDDFSSTDRPLDTSDRCSEHNWLYKILGVGMEDPWYQARAKGSFVNNQGNPLFADDNYQPYKFTSPTDDPVAIPLAGFSNWFQQQNVHADAGEPCGARDQQLVIFPKIDYDFWKNLSQSAATTNSGVKYLRWVSGENYTDGITTKNFAKWINTHTGAKPGFYFFDTRNGLNPQGAAPAGVLAPALTLNSSDDGNTMLAKGFIYLNAESYGSQGITGPSAWYNFPGEPFRDVGYKRVDEDALDYTVNADGSRNITGGGLFKYESDGTTIRIEGTGNGDFDWQDLNVNGVLDIFVEQRTITIPGTSPVETRTEWFPRPWSPGCIPGNNYDALANCSEPHEPYLNLIYPLRSSGNVSEACCGPGGRPRRSFAGWQDPTAVRKLPVRKTPAGVPVTCGAGFDPACTSNGFDRDGPLTEDFGSNSSPILDGVLYNEGDFDTQGNANYFGSILINGSIWGTGTPEVWFDEMLIKGGWQDKFKELPRVFVTAHETEQ
jgi:hypothetical protein